MTRLSRGAVLVRGMDALRAFHGHVAFCKTCKPVIDNAAGEKVELTLDEVKRSFCPKGRKVFKTAFNKTGSKLWSMLEPPDRHKNSQSSAEGEVGKAQTAASSDLPKAD